ncbi:hypothetical protein HZ326_3449 [Fusarium oxysporum f. sp. albedinis]|nr:hypothetical protein HZ326_3449 [Fusarium oxysporum f. sp. albedinis]
MGDGIVINTAKTINKTRRCNKEIEESKRIQKINMVNRRSSSFCPLLRQVYPGQLCLALPCLALPYLLAQVV